MGNGSSGGNGNRMAISAMADMMALNKQQLLDLRSVCLRYVKPSRRDGGHDKIFLISKEELRESMKEMELDLNDIDVIEHLHTMWDKYGDDKVNLLLFLAGISPLASTMDIETKLSFAFEIFDEQNTGYMKKSDAKKILSGINSTASYFGDAVISKQAIEIIADDVYKDQSEIFYQEYMDLFATHPAVIQFSSSSGTMKFEN